MINMILYPILWICVNNEQRMTFAATSCVASASLRSVNLFLYLDFGNPIIQDFLSTDLSRSSCITHPARWSSPIDRNAIPVKYTIVWLRVYLLCTVCQKKKSQLTIWICQRKKWLSFRSRWLNNGRYSNIENWSMSLLDWLVSNLTSVLIKL